MIDFAGDHPFIAFLLVLILLGGAMSGLILLGIRIGKKHKEEDEKDYNLGIIDGALFGLFGLLLAFSFQGAVQRFVERRKLVEEEAKALGTAYQLLDVLPDPARSDLRGLFRTYVDHQIQAYRNARHRALLK